MARTKQGQKKKGENTRRYNNRSSFATVTATATAGSSGNAECLVTASGSHTSVVAESSNPGYAAANASASVVADGSTAQQGSWGCSGSSNRGHWGKTSWGGGKNDTDDDETEEEESVDEICQEHLVVKRVKGFERLSEALKYNCLLPSIPSGCAVIL